MIETDGMTKSIQVLYFAILREQRGASRETRTTAAGTVAELYEELRGQHGLRFPAEHLRAAINDEFTPWTTPLKPGDVVAFIPPVAGG